MSIVSTNPTNASSSNPASCPALEEITIFIGSTSAALNLGIAQNQAYAEITMGGEVYSTLASGYFSASLDTFDSSDGYMTGKFEFLAQIPGASTVVVKGDYAGN